MKKYFAIMGIALILGACSSPSKKTIEETQAVEEPVIEMAIDSMAVEMDSVVAEMADSIIAE